MTSISKSTSILTSSTPSLISNSNTVTLTNDSTSSTPTLNLTSPMSSSADLPLILGITIPALIILTFLGIVSFYLFKRYKGSNPNLDESIDLYTLYF